MIRVIAVDDAPANGDIYRAALAGLPDIDYLGQISFGDALIRGNWAEVDTVLLDLGHLESTSLDRFTGCLVAERIRSLHPRSGISPTITVLTSWTDMPGVRIRAAEAGVDFWYRRDEATHSHERLRNAVRTPQNRVPQDDVQEWRKTFGLRSNVTINNAAQSLSQAVTDVELDPGVLRQGFGSRTEYRRATDRIKVRMGALFFHRNVGKDSSPFKPKGGEDPALPQLVRFAEETMVFGNARREDPPPE